MSVENTDTGGKKVKISYLACNTHLEYNTLAHTEVKKLNNVICGSVSQFTITVAYIDSFHDIEIRL